MAAEADFLCGNYFQVEDQIVVLNCLNWLINVQIGEISKFRLCERAWTNAYMYDNYALSLSLSVCLCVSLSDSANTREGGSNMNEGRDG